VASFYDFALVCQDLGQTQSRLQMAEAVGTFLAALSVDEAEVAARFMVGRALEQGEEKRLQISGRAIWKIVAEMTGGGDQSEDIFAAAEDFGEAVAVMLRMRATDPERSRDAMRAIASSRRCGRCSSDVPRSRGSTWPRF